VSDDYILMEGVLEIQFCGGGNMFFDECSGVYGNNIFIDRA
jgi:hypothetical protein